MRLPGVCDIVFVSDPDQVRRVETSGDVDRLHAYETRRLPWWVRRFFRATKFHDDRGDLWFCPMEPASNPTYVPRRDYLAEKAADGYGPDDVARIADLLARGASDDELARAMVQIVNRRFFGGDVPDEIVEAAKHTVQDLPTSLLPWKYRRGVASQRAITDYCARTLPEGTHLVDVGHNVGEVVQATAGALRRVAANPGVPVERLFTDHAPTPQVLRIAVRPSTIGGLLRGPMRPGWTVVILKVGEAARRSGDLRFTFGAGGPERLCVFQDFFLAFMRDLQAVLRDRGGGAPTSRGSASSSP